MRIITSIPFLFAILILALALPGCAALQRPNPYYHVDHPNE